jgi:hypothetical protein
MLLFAFLLDLVSTGELLPDLDHIWTCAAQYTEEELKKEVEIAVDEFKRYNQEYEETKITEQVSKFAWICCKDTILQKITKGVPDLF